jgi:amino acid adenylation domain-containing protein
MQPLTIAPAEPEAGNGRGAFPLSYGQRALWFLDRLAGGDAAYVIAGAARVVGDLDAAALKRAALALSARHPALRTTFDDGPAGPVQRVGEEPQVDFLEADGTDAGADLARRLSELAFRPFDLARGPLWRLALLRLAGGGWALALSIHHIVSDFWSLGVMLRDLGALYGAELARSAGETEPREAAALPAPGLDFAEVVRREEESLAGPEGERLWRFWRQALQGVPLVLDLAPDRPRPPVAAHRRGSRRLRLPAAATDALRRSTRQRGATFYMGLLAAFAVLLHRRSGQERLVVGCPTSGRKTAELAGLVAYLVNPVAIAVDVGRHGGEPTFAELLDRVRAAALAAFAHRDYPLPLLAERLQPERDPGVSPIFQVMCVLQKGRRAEEEGLAALAVGEAGGRFALGPATLTTLAIEAPGAQFDLSLGLAETARGLSGRLGYDRDLFEAATAARLAGQLENLLAALAAPADGSEELARPLADLPLLAPAERHQLLHEWSGAPQEYPGSDLLHELFAVQAARRPEAEAVWCAGAWLTYGELDARAERLAGRLKAAGVGPESLVGVCLTRSFDLVVGVLGILKAGGAYLPLDPGLPAERLAFLIRDARLAALLAEGATEGLLPPSGVPRLRVGDPAWADDRAAPPVGMSPEHPAYVIYTSGSTGWPKGVVIPHRAIAARMRFACADDLLPGERMIQKTTLSFDVSVFEIFGPLLTGGRLVLPRPGGERDPSFLLTMAAEHEITRLSFPPALLTLLLEQEALPALAALRVVVTGGETVPPDLPPRFHARMKAHLDNRYGPTEATISVTSWRSWRSRPGEEVPLRLPIGRPVAVADIHILRAGCELVPLGVPGELCIGGVCLARGYLGRPELTAAAFVPHPFAAAPGARLYRTGDVVRHRADGEIEFLGRVDGQVKVRGFRVELGEIEAALLEHPGVKEAAVADRDDPTTGSRRLVAWLVPQPGAAVTTLSITEVKERLLGRLPGYMVPAAFVVLPALPLTPSGKVDRRALPEPAEEEGETAAFEPPVGPLEELLAGLWAGLLNLPRVGRRASFFDLGGHSLLAARLVARVRETLGAELPLRAVFEAPTVAGLATAVAAARGARTGEEPPPLVAGRRRPEDPVPLSYAQERLWFLDQLAPGLPGYNLPGAFELRGRLDRPAFAASLGAIVCRHEALRTTFAAVDGRPLQVVAPAPASWAVPLLDLAGLPEAVRAGEAARLTREEALRPFDLARGPLLRCTLLRLDRLGEERHRALLTLHHIAADGWSVGILARELGALYARKISGSGGSPAALPELPVQYADYALWQRGWLTGEALGRQLAWWRERLAGAPEVLELPADRPRPAVLSLAGGSVPVALGPELVRALAVLGGRAGATPFMVLLAAFAALLSRLAGQERVVVGSPVANRDRVETEGLIGCFVNTLPLPVDLAGAPDLPALLGEVRETALGAYAHQAVPFEKLVEELAPVRSLAWSPLFQAMLALQNVSLPRLALAGLAVEPVAMEGLTEKFDLTLALAEREEGIVGSLSYSADLFERATAERLAGWFQVLLAAAVGSPGGPERPPQPIAELPLLSVAERAELLAWSAGEKLPEEGSETTLDALFAAQAARTPAAVALICGSDRLTYGELAARAGRLGRALRGRGIGPEARVGVCLERGPELVVALLGVLAAGGAYVPLDPAYPAERLAGMLAASGARLLLTRKEISSRLPALPALPPITERMLLDDLDVDAARAEPPAPAPSLRPENLAYLIFTSGSTGVPKGVAIEHRSAVALVRWALGEWSAAELSGVLFATSISFDLSIFELFVPLARGGWVILAENALALPSLPAAAEVTLVNTVPSVMAELLRQGALPAAVRTVNLAGEALERPLVDALYDLPGIERVWNLYGPSEDTTYSTAALLARGAARTPEIGRPIAGTRAYVLDPQGELSPPGVPGELYLGGRGLARGYLDLPERTAERFVPDPWGDGERLYRTGDRVLYRARGSGEMDGDLEFLGRLDRQVKVRGFRIEPGEIESVLAGHPGVRQAAVLARREEGPGGTRLVAYAVAPGEGADSLRADLAERLPAYMVPAAFVLLEALPLTPNGKVDRRSLARIEPGRERPADREEEPRTPVEVGLAAIWSEVLEVQGIGREDDFFGIGGHSLLATQALSRVRRAFGVELPVKRLFEAPTLAGLARAIEEALGAGGAAGGPALRPRGLSTAPLSFAQERLWFLDQLDPGSAAYNMAAAFALAGELDLPAFVSSLREVVRRHGVLRTVFRPGVQIIAPEGVARKLPVPRVDLAALPEAARGPEAARLAREEAGRPFDLARGPLLRATLLHLGSRHHRALFTLHHIAGDGWSVGVLIGELRALYRAFRAGLSSPLPDLPLQYADFAAAQREWLAGVVLEGEVAHWREALAGLAPLALPADHPRPLRRTGRGGLFRFALPRAETEALVRFSRAEGATLFMTLLAGLAALLGRLANAADTADVAVGSPIANRTRPEIEGLIGFFVNTLVLRVDLAGDPGFREILARARRTALTAYAHQELPFEKLVEALSPERDASRTPFFQVLFALQNAPAGELALPGLTLTPLPPAETAAKFDLSLLLTETAAGDTGDAGLVGVWEYDRDLFDRATIGRLTEHLATLLKGALAAPERRFTELPLLGAAERAALLAEWSGGASDYPRAASLPALFAAQASARPDAVAVVAEGDAAATEHLSYGALERRARRLARHLRGLGVEPGTRVGLCRDRSAERVVATLAILLAGGAYVPLDPSYPQERLELLLRAAGAPVILAGEPELALLPETGAAIVHLAEAGWAAPAEAGADLPEVPAEALAYVMFTSGSTGVPKGVAVPHRAVARLVLATDYATFGPGEVLLQLAPFAFDAATLELWGALLQGGRVAVPPPGPLSLAELGQLLARHGVTTLWLTAGLFHPMVDANLPGLSGLSQLLAGGDVLSVPHLLRAAAGLPGTRVICGYGPTENTTFTSCHPVRDPADLVPSAPLGRPIANTWVRVLDRGLEAAPIGVPGELAAGGDGLAWGYLGRPDLTAERFVPDPFGRAGERLYRTGDLARFRPDGRLEFLGRLDAQVKIRGFRVEPGEVEAVLASHPEVRQAAVLTRGEGEGRGLVAYLVMTAGVAGSAVGGGGGGSGALAAWLRERLPEPLVPAAFVLLPELPLTEHGKIDRRALAQLAAAPEAVDPAVGRAPRGPLEELLAGIWEDLLGVARVGRADSFFDLGGHSLLATRAVARVREALGVEIPLRRLFEAPTLSGFAALVEEARSRGERPAEPPLRPVARSGDLPLSFAQERLWFLDQLQPGSSAYNIPAALRLCGRLDVPALAAALAGLSERHEALRTRFAARDGRPLQVVSPPGPIALPVVDLHGLGSTAREGALRTLARREARAPFDLEAGPVLRTTLLRLALEEEAAEEEHALLVTLHHIAGDGWSVGVFVRELGALYGAGIAGRSRRPSPLPALPIQYADFALWQREQLTGAVLERQLAWWRERLSGMPALLDLPLDRPRPPVLSERPAATQPIRLPADLASALAALSRRAGATLFMTLLAAYQALLGRLSGQERLVVGTPVANRTRSEVFGLIGFFVNTLALSADLAGDPAFSALLARTRETALGAYAHQDLPFERLVEELQPERSLAHTPIFQVVFALQNAPLSSFALPGLSLAVLPPETGVAKFDLSLSLAEGPGGIGGAFEHSPALFDRSTVARLAGHFVRLLEGVVARPDERVSTLPLLSAGEWHQLLAEWGEGEAASPSASSLDALFAEQARRRPEAVALVGGGAEGERISYGELAARAGRLAAALRGRGIGPEERVGVCLERGPELVVALLGVLAAGGAYVPLDPAYPAERLAGMLAASGARLLLTQKNLSDRLTALPAITERMLFDALDEAARAEPLAPAPAVQPENLAYLIFTSGSTGLPKGVAIEHRSAVALVRWALRKWNAAELAGVLFATSISFDLSIFELFVPLAQGGRVILAENALALPSHPAAAEVTLVNTVPSVLSELLRQGGLPAAVRTVNLAGEALERPLVDALYDLPGIERVWNLYGPSEDTTYSTAALLARQTARTPEIGRPIAGTRAYVLDPHGDLAPSGVPGELHLGGQGLARGYLDLPERTAERFVPDLWGDGERLYRTGDRVRYRPGGGLEFLGRLDQQVKIRGFRIEPGEVEAVLAAHPAVRQAAVLAREDRPGDKRLVAYVVARPEAGDAGHLIEALRAHASALLPAYLVPAVFLVLPALPRSANGKLDRAALPAPEWGSASVYVAPRTANEELLAAIWAEVLHREQVGVEDDFFALGGHSLLATQVISRVRRTFGVEIPQRRMFERPTVAGLAAEIAAATASIRGSERRPPLLAQRREGPVPLSFAQQRLWFLDQLAPGNPAYNIPLGLDVQGELDLPTFAATLSEVVRRHESLRTVFAAGEGGPEQVIRAAAPVDLPVVDLAELLEPARRGEAERLMAVEARRPFDLARGPLLRATCLSLGRAEHRLLLNLHHIVGDGWSMAVLVREVGALYPAFRQGLPSPLPALAVQYADFALWQRQWLSGEVLESEIAVWRARLAGAPPALDLPTDHPRPAAQSLRGGSVRFDLPGELTASLAALSRGAGGTLFMALLAAWFVFLSRFSGQDDLTVGTPIAGRTQREVEDLVGFFVNTLVLRGDLSGDIGFGELLERVRQVVLEAYAHQEVPFEMLVERLQPERNLGRSPLFQAMLVLQNAPLSPLTLPDLRLALLPPSQGPAKFDLTLVLVPTSAGLSGVLEYDRALFDRTTARRFAQSFERLLRGAVAAPESLVADLPLLSPAEAEQLREWRGSAAASGAGTIPDLFLQQAAATPDAVAVVDGSDGGTALSYGELALRARRLAARLRELGVGMEVPVGLFHERSAGLVLSTLAVLLAGGAYVPLDPASPAERLAWLLAETGGPVVLAAAGLRERLPAGTRRLALDEGTLGATGEERMAPAPVGPDNLAYLMFTSGSTGAPKGVAVTHRGVVRLVRGADYARFGPEEVFLQLAPASFDAATLEIWGPLLHGGRLVLAPPQALGLGELGELLARHGVTTLWLTAGLFHDMVEENLAGLLPLTQLLAGGDALSPAHVERALRGLPGTRLVNGYGPTEGTTFTCCWSVDAERLGVSVSIGRPIAGTEVAVVDGAGRPLPAGAAGELVMGGAGLARGYWRRPDLTAERFRPDPLSARAGERAYRTGDRVRWLPDGRLEFLGRLDRQVKIRGFRIEPGEVEAALAAHPGVRQAVVLAREDRPGDKRLVAYVVGEALEEELREHLRARLPEPLVPAAIVDLPSLPLTANGKVDRAALPAPEWRSGAAHVAPRTPLEEVLSRLWRDLLGVERPGVRDSFFQLGGHSLLATQLVARVRATFQVELPLQRLFADPTIEALAEAIRGAETKPGQSEKIARVLLRVQGGRPSADST